MPPFSESAELLGWIDRLGRETEPPQAWSGGWLELRWPTADGQGLRLELDGQPLPLLLSLQQGRPQWRAQWPAQPPGFCRLSLWREQQELARTAIFVPTSQLSFSQWRSLLTELRYRLPARLLLKAGPGTGGRVPVRAGGVARNSQEEQALLWQCLEGDDRWTGLLQSLDWLRRHARQQPRLSGSWQALHRSRHPVARPSLGPLTPVTPVWNLQAQTTNDTVENRFVAGVVNTLLRRLQDFGDYALQLGELATAERFLDAASRLRQSWRRHPLAELEPRPSPPAQTAILSLPGYADCFRIWQVLHQGWQPQDSDLWLPYHDLALLYQHFCLLRLAGTLAELPGWQADAIRAWPRPGRPLLSLRQGHYRLELIPEASYGSQGEMISLSRRQRPDVSLVVSERGRAVKLLVFETKFRSEGQQPLKQDLDKLHAYRDAIRLADGQPAVAAAILLYPGPFRSYPPLLDAWSLLPAAPDAPALAERLHPLVLKCL